jgi:hypothetical protein
LKSTSDLKDRALFALTKENENLEERRDVTLLTRIIIEITEVTDKVHHHQPIIVPTAGAQAFLMDYT